MTLRNLSQENWLEPSKKMTMAFLFRQSPPESIQNNVEDSSNQNRLINNRDQKLLTLAGDKREENLPQTQLAHFPGLKANYFLLTKSQKFIAITIFILTMIAYLTTYIVMVVVVPRIKKSST